MLHADEAIEQARVSFGLLSPPANADLQNNYRSGRAKEIDLFIASKTWLEIATADSLVLEPSPNIDLGEIFVHLSQVGMRYYTPGFLIHFLRRGLYRDSIFGGDVYFRFVMRLQPDDERIAKSGGCKAYFAFSDDQEKLCADLMWKIYLEHGDPYEAFDQIGFEHIDRAKRSIARALLSYWLSKSTYG